MTDVSVYDNSANSVYDNSAKSVYDLRPIHQKKFKIQITNFVYYFRAGLLKK